jgi:chaperone modulatory protein CbpM
MGQETTNECLFCLREDRRVSLTELKQISGLTIKEIEELVDFGILEVQGKEADNWVFSSHCITVVRRATRLKKDFDLNPSGIALALTYLERIQDLEVRLHELECQLLQ